MFFSTIFFFVVALVQYGNGALVQPSIWPMPASIESASNATCVKTIFPSVKFLTQGNPLHTLDELYSRYEKIMFPHPSNPTTSSADDSRTNYAITTEILVSVQSEDEAYPTLLTDESYTISIVGFSPTIKIVANNVYGAIRAMETLSQIIVYDFDSDSYSTPIMEIQDSPRYPHRGMLLDTARHFQPMSAIKKTIDALSYAKYNVFHWHVVDTQAFPFQSLSSPKLWDGSYTSQEKYTHAEIAEVVEYGRLRAVKVMIEFDVPGHAASWCVGYPEICPSPSCLQPLDPSTDATFDLIERLLQECTIPASGESESLFPYDLVHLGGDEVSYDCWEQSPHIQAWEKEQGLDGSEDVYKYFVDRVSQMAIAQGKHPVQWVEVFEHFGDKLDNNTIVHVWKDKSTMDGVLQAGYRALLSDEDLWYLDHEDILWDAMYTNEPTDGLSAGSDPSLIMGGESCMWAENVDPSDLDNTIWPRAAAVSERLWTPKDKTDVVAALDRIETFRCLLVQRGIGAAPVLNHYARTEPPSPGSCYVQRR